MVTGVEVIGENMAGTSVLGDCVGEFVTPTDVGTNVTGLLEGF